MRRYLFVLLLVAAAAIVLPTAQAQTPSCPWQASLAPEVVRSPVQMDVHAAYRIFAFTSDGSVGYRVRGEFPFAAFLSFTTYDGADGLLYAAMLDYRIKPDPGSVNPFWPGELVNAQDRFYTVTVLPSGTIPDASMPNPIFLPPPPRRSNQVTAVLVQRIYLPEPQVNDRFGGVDAPTIEPFEVDHPGSPAACPTGDFSDIVDQFGSFSGDFSQSPAPRDGKIEFYRPPVSQVPYADGSGQLTKHDCTSYLMATVASDQVAVVRVPAVPGFFDNSNVEPGTVFAITDVRYLSVGSYGASPLFAADNENIAGPDVKMLPDGSAVFVGVPHGLSASLTEQVQEKADALGYNVLPLAEEGLVIKPFLIYRNKVPKGGFAGDIKNVPCFRGSKFNRAPFVYAASPANMGPYAPTGVECSPLDFAFGSCGQ